MEKEGFNNRWALFDMERSAMAKYNGALITYDHSPPLRTSGGAIFVISLDIGRDALQQPRSPARAHRYIADCERFALQGHSHIYAEFFETQQARRSATGNAYAVPQLGIMAVPLLVAWRAAGFPRLSHQELHDLSDQVILQQPVEVPGAGNSRKRRRCTKGAAIAVPEPGPVNSSSS